MLTECLNSGIQVKGTLFPGMGVAPVGFSPCFISLQPPAPCSQTARNSGASKSLQGLILRTRIPFLCFSVSNSACLWICSFCLSEAFCDWPLLSYLFVLLTACVALITFIIPFHWFFHLNVLVDNKHLEASALFISSMAGIQHMPEHGDTW